jgi:hypothetical protein
LYRPAASRQEKSSRVTRWLGVAGHLEKKAEGRLAYGKSDAVRESTSLIEREAMVLRAARCAWLATDCQPALAAALGPH